MTRFDALLCVFGSLACVAVIATAASLEPDARGHGTHERLGLAPCSFMQRHGRPCISCGMTTAFAAMAHGRLDLALAANPYGAGLFLLVVAAPFWFVNSLRKGLPPLRFLDRPGGRRAFFVAGLLLLVNWGWMLTRPPA